MKRKKINLARFVRRRRALSAGGWIVLLLLILAAVADHSGLLRPRGSDWERFDRQTFPVARVVDGDTLVIGELLNEVPVRLIGVDAPELRQPDGSGPDYWAERATAYLRARCGGRPVMLKLEQTQTRDRYDRLLACVYLNDAEMLNLALIRDGQAYADRRFKHTYRPQFEMTETEARKKQRGLWKDITPEQMPAWRRKWLAELGKN